MWLALALGTTATSFARRLAAGLALASEPVTQHATPLLKPPLNKGSNRTNTRKNSNSPTLHLAALPFGRVRLRGFLVLPASQKTTRRSMPDKDFCQGYKSNVPGKGAFASRPEIYDPRGKGAGFGLRKSEILGKVCARPTTNIPGSMQLLPEHQHFVIRNYHFPPRQTCMYPICVDPGT